MASTGDPYILNVQKWVNEKFRGENGYTEISETGLTGWNTIYALLHGLQITLEVGSTANNFGNGTINAFNAFVKKHGEIKERTKEQDFTLKSQLLDVTGNVDKDEVSKLIDQYDKIHGIIQGALLCKGYAIGANTPTGNFYGGTASAIKKLKEDAGLSDTSSIVTLNIMKALMSMDYFYSYDNSERTQNIINMQRYLNANYESYIGLTPCDGIYSRGTNKALIYAIQAEEGLPINIANGNFGPTTQNLCPEIPYNNVETNYYGEEYNDTSNFKRLINICLYMNGIGNGSISSDVNPVYIKQFQSKYGIPFNGKCDLTTWLSLLVSSGDTNRSATACDCATILDDAKAKTLYKEGYRYVGRYLSGTIKNGVSKALTREEIHIAFNNGLNIFPIQQGNASYIDYFTDSQAVDDVNNAYQHAVELGIPTNTIIYFAVDCDPQDSDITNNIIPYFKKVYETMRDEKGRKYKIGIYGTRNVCKRVSKLGYAVSSFVSDMSTGFSGNLGFTIPDNWAFDQFKTVTIGSGTGKIEIDKDGFSGFDKGFSTIDEENESIDYWEEITDEEIDYSKLIGGDSNQLAPIVYVNRSSRTYNVYSTKEEGIKNFPANKELVEVLDAYGWFDPNPSNTNKFGVAGDKVGEIKPGDLFVRFSNDVSETAPQGDSVHKVLFRNNNGKVRYGYIQEYMEAEKYSAKESARFGMEAFYYSKFNPDTNKLEDQTLNIKNNEFTLSRNLKYLSVSGKELGVLEEGTIVRGGGYAGMSHPDYMSFSEKYDEESKSWIPVDQKNNSRAYICLDMENGVNGYFRALW